MIYCVEDEKNIRELVLYALSASGFEAVGLEDGKQLEQQLALQLPDLILLDIMLPGENGLEILKKLKSNLRTKSIPVIMVTAKSSEYDKVIGLDEGADDYIAKPFGMMELVARIKAVLRRLGKQQETGVIEYQNIRMVPSSHQVHVGEREVSLTLKEYELLKYLLENLGTVLTRDQLLNYVWGYDFDGETRTVDVHIRTLRQKLGGSRGDDQNHPRCRISDRRVDKGSYEEKNFYQFQRSGSGRDVDYLSGFSALHVSETGGKSAAAGAGGSGLFK